MANDGNGRTSGPEYLSSQQSRIIALLAQGKGDKEIAMELRVKVPTVRSHLSRIFRKTGAVNRVELAVRAPELLKQRDGKLTQ